MVADNLKDEGGKGGVGGARVEEGFLSVRHAKSQGVRMPLPHLHMSTG